MDIEIGGVLRQWRKANHIKQAILAETLGVTQATVSRWESGLDEPSPAQYVKIRNLVGQVGRSRFEIERDVISLQTGLRALVDVDGIRIISLTKLYESFWPEMIALKEMPLADKLTSFSREIFYDEQLMRSIRRGEVALISGVSEEHFEGVAGNSFRHRWTATYRKTGSRLVSELSFEPCSSAEILGIKGIVRVDEIK